MPVSITISGVTGTSPYNIFLCDTGQTTCVYIDQITTGDIPYTFSPPLLMQNYGSYLVKIIDSLPCTTVVTPLPIPGIDKCYIVYLNSTDNKLYYSDLSYNTTSYFDTYLPSTSAITRTDDYLWVFDGFSTIYEYDVTSSPTLTRNIDTTSYSVDIYAMCTFTSTTELLTISSTGDVNVVDISTNYAQVTNPPGLFGYNIGTTPPSDCNLLRDNNIGITYLKRGLSQIKAYYDDGTEYSSGAWPSGYLKGLFRDPNTAEIFGVTETGFVEKISQPPGPMTFIPIGNLSPDNTVELGVAQSDTCIPTPSSFKMFFTNLTGVTIGFNSTSFSWIDWGDGNTISGGTSNKSHTYSSPYTGFINVYSYNDFQDFTSLGQSYSLNSSVTSGTSIELPSQYFLLSEMKKIKGLQSVSINAYGGFPPSGSTSDLPSGLTTCSFVQNAGYVTGYTSTFPTGLVTCIMNGDFYGDVAGLPRPLDYLDLRNSHLTGHIYDFPSGLTTLRLYGSDTFSGDSSEWSRNLETLSLINTSVTYGNVSNLPSGLTYLYLYDTNTLSGDTSGLPSGLTTNDIYGNNTISGDTSGLPRSGNTAIEGFNTISGNISDLPYSATSISIKGNNTISGDTSGLPGSIHSFTISQNGGTVTTGNTISGNISGFTGSSLTGVYVAGANTISGDTTDIPTTSSFSDLTLFGFNTLSGDIANIPPNIDVFVVYGNNQLSGDISGLPTSTLTQFQVGGNNTISGGFSGFPTSSGIQYFTLIGGSIDYTPGSASGMGLPNGLTQFIYTPSGAVGSALSSSDVDSIIFAATGITWAGTSRALTINGGNSSPTAASLAARQSLTGGSFNIQVSTN